MQRRFFLFLGALFFKGNAIAAPRQRSAAYRSARAMLALSRQKDSWEHTMRHDAHAGAFLWTGDGEAVERWNELYAGRDDIGTVIATVEGRQEHFFLSYGASKLEAPVRHDCDDETVVVLTLNRLVKNVTEVRFCVDSHHASDRAFLAMPPGEWAALEAEFGAPAVSYRFMSLPDTMATFSPRLQKTSDKVQARPYYRTA